MGLMRVFLLVIICILLLISLLGFNSLFVVSSSLTYENVNSQVKSILNENFTDNILPDVGEIAGIEIDDFNLSEQEESLLNQTIEIYCQNQTEYVFSLEGYTIDLSCEDIQGGGTQAIIDETLNDFIEGVYYDSYDCDYWDCFEKEETPLFLISEKSHDYWQSKMWIMFFVSFFLVVLAFFLVKEKQNFPIVLGGVLIVSVLPLLGIEKLVSGLFGSFAVFFTSILTNINMIFVANLVIGLILIALGIILKVIGIERIKKMFSRKE